MVRIPHWAEENGRFGIADLGLRNGDFSSEKSEKRKKGETKRSMGHREKQ